MRQYLLLFLLVLCGVKLWSQRQSFNADRELFPQQLKTFLEEETKADNDALEALLLEFNGIWTAGGINDSELVAIAEVSNQLVRKRMTDYEAWQYWLRLIMHLETNEEERYGQALLESLMEYSRKNPSRNTFEYLKTLNTVFYDNVLFDDGRVRWAVRDGYYNFSFKAGPIFSFEDVDIWGFYKNDSTIIRNTSGLYDPLTRIFTGSNGGVFFTRVGLSPDSATVELERYTLNAEKTDFEADSAILVSKVFVREPLMGKFEEKLTSQSGRGLGTFPRFTSYRDDIVVENLLPSANYMGGFAIVGSKFYGSGSAQKKARFSFQYEGVEVVRTESDRFLLTKDKLYSEDVAVKIFVEGDSIYHPKVTVRYLPEMKQLSIIRINEGLGMTPFTDSYHKLDILFESLNWKLDEPLLKIGNLAMGTETPVFFESQNYYRGERFDQIQGLDDKSPLMRLKEMSEVYGKREFSNEEVARFMRMDPRAAHIFMMQMSILGFVTYDLDTKEAVLRDKVFDYIANYQKKRDYDVIRFVSNTSKPNNATLSLLDYALEIEGVKAISLSDSQKVGLFPYEEKIKVYKDLNFDFGGKITAGLFSYWGREFKFNYEQFRINMQDVDSMRFKVKSFEQNALGQRTLVDVKTVLQDLTGELLIDKPNNKSGKVSYSEYPIFKSAKDSYVYYDKPTIWGGVYDRNRFYVTLEPFEIDSLDNISTDGLKFDGTFTSAGIFPDLQQEIKVQRDYSLGFKDVTPPEGLSAYGKGTFSNEITLSNEGLIGDGEIRYLNSLAVGKSFVFFPDSTNGPADSYEIGVDGAYGQYPHVLASDVRLHWEPLRDVLYTTATKEKPFAMYDEVGMKSVGTLAHGPVDLRGDVLASFYNAEARSRDFQFNRNDFNADSLGFRVRVSPEAPWAFALTDANGEVNFSSMKGDFFLNNPTDYFSFPDNQYITFMDYAGWNIPEKSFDLKKTQGDKMARMVSIHPQQDSLQFNSERNRFFLQNSLLESFKVPEILVADAQIIPDTGYVAIDPGAKMRTLTNAVITANLETKYHEFYGGVVDIKSRNYYAGTADYEYLDEDGTPWPIRFEQIRVDTSGTTVGKANISQEEAFYMSPFFAYYGRVGLKADRNALDFNGYTHIESACPSVSTDWFAFSSLVDPANIVIDLPEIDPEDKTKNLNNGIFLAADTTSGYAAFLSKRVPGVDKEMFFATGKLYYDRSISSYVIVSKERFEDPNAPGNYLAFDNSACTMHGEGLMSLGSDREQLDIQSYGTIDYNLRNDNMEMDLVMAINFHFNSDVQKRMAEIIQGKSGLESSELTRPAFEVASRELLDDKERAKFTTAVNSFGAPEEFPDEMQATIFLTGVKLKWTPTSVSFLSEGPISVGGFDKYIANRKVEGSFELQRKRRGDELYLYLELDKATFFYFEYKRNQLSLFSSEEDVMNFIKETDLKKRRKEVSGKPPFTYSVGTKGKLFRFLNKMEDVEAGDDE